MLEFIIKFKTSLFPILFMHNLIVISFSVVWENFSRLRSVTEILGLGF